MLSVVIIAHEQMLMEGHWFILLPIAAGILALHEVSLIYSWDFSITVIMSSHKNSYSATVDLWQGWCVAIPRLLSLVISNIRFPLHQSQGLCLLEGKVILVLLPPDVMFSSSCRNWLLCFITTASFYINSTSGALAGGAVISKVKNPLSSLLFPYCSMRKSPAKGFLKVFRGSSLDVHGLAWTLPQAQLRTQICLPSGTKMQANSLNLLWATSGKNSS